MRSKTQKLVMTAMLAALVCIMTMIIKIPTPLSGYINLGDSIVLLSGWVLSPWYGFLAAGFGSALADIFSGYVMYAFATFFIKGSMAFSAYYIYKFLRLKTKSLIARIFSGIVAEIIMILGYFLFEGTLYGFGPSSVNIPSGLIQGIIGLIIGVILINIFYKKYN